MSMVFGSLFLFLANVFSRFQRDRVHFNCIHCKESLSAPVEDLGNPVCCPSCTKYVLVPRCLLEGANKVKYLCRGCKKRVESTREALYRSAYCKCGKAHGVPIHEFRQHEPDNRFELKRIAQALGAIILISFLLLLTVIRIKPKPKPIGLADAPKKKTLLDPNTRKRISQLMEDIEKKRGDSDVESSVKHDAPTTNAPATDGSENRERPNRTIHGHTLTARWTDYMFSFTQTVGGLVLLFMIMLVSLVAYFLPAIFAFCRPIESTVQLGVLMINLLFGFTGLGWLFAFHIALLASPQNPDE